MFLSSIGITESSSSANSTPAGVSFVGTGTVFEGTLTADGDLRVAGRVVGALDVKGTAVVAETGVVEGEIRAEEARIAGEVCGDVVVDECLVLERTGLVDGTIQTDRLVIEEGATFVGKCVMNRSDTELRSSSDGMAEESPPEVRVSEDVHSDTEASSQSHVSQKPDAHTDDES